MFLSEHLFIIICCRLCELLGWLDLGHLESLLSLNGFDTVPALVNISRVGIVYS